MQQVADIQPQEGTCSLTLLNTTTHILLLILDVVWHRETHQTLFTRTFMVKFPKDKSLQFNLNKL